MRPLVTRPTYSVPSAAWAMPLGYRAPAGGTMLVAAQDGSRSPGARAKTGKTVADTMDTSSNTEACRLIMLSPSMCALPAQGPARTVSGASSVAHSSSARSSVSAARASSR